MFKAEDIVGPGLPPWSPYEKRRRQMEQMRRYRALMLGMRRRRKSEDFEGIFKGTEELPWPFGPREPFGPRVKLQPEIWPIKPMY